MLTLMTKVEFKTQLFSLKVVPKHSSQNLFTTEIVALNSILKEILSASLITIDNITPIFGLSKSRIGIVVGEKQLLNTFSQKFKKVFFKTA